MGREDGLLLFHFALYPADCRAGPDSSDLRLLFPEVYDHFTLRIKTSGCFLHMCIGRTRPECAVFRDKVRSIKCCLKAVSGISNACLNLTRFQKNVLGVLTSHDKIFRSWNVGDN